MLLGQTLLEAMARGTPAICTNVASMPEVVEDGVTEILLSRPNDLQRIRRKARMVRDIQKKPQDGAGSASTCAEEITWPSVVQRVLRFTRMSLLQTLARQTSGLIGRQSRLISRLRPAYESLLDGQGRGSGIP